jgi:nucleoside-diphosphate-sugar epimerase
MKKILIAGGAGYIGTRFCEQYDRHYDITVLDPFWFGDNIRTDNVRKWKGEILDLDVDTLKEYDAVLFMGGLSNDPMVNFRPDMNFTENSAIPTYLAWLTKEAGIKKFIGASSCSVYGFTRNKTLTENSPIKPYYPYGIAKLQLEKGISILEDENFRPVLFRKGTVGGWSNRMRYDLVVNTMFMTAITTGKITVNSPMLWRPLIDIRDVINGYRLALEVDEEVSGIYNLSGVNMTIGSLGKLIKKQLNAYVDVELSILDVKDVRNYKVNCDKAADELEFKAKYKPADSIREILENIEDFNTYDFSKDIYYNINVFKEVTK